MDQIDKARLTQLTQKIGVMKGMQMSDEEIEKSFDKSELDLIEKAVGEGSRGGKVIGHTKSGKPVYETKEAIKDIKSYSKHLTEHGVEHHVSDYMGGHIYVNKKDYDERIKPGIHKDSKYLSEHEDKHTHGTGFGITGSKEGLSKVKEKEEKLKAKRKAEDDKRREKREKSTAKPKSMVEEFANKHNLDMKSLWEAVQSDYDESDISKLTNRDISEIADASGIKEINKAFDIEKSEDSKEKKVARVMREFKEGKLKSSSGEVVTDQKQAVAIAMSEAGLNKEKAIENDIEKSSFEDICKSHLNDLFYSENMKIKKSGKEFKDALNKQLLSEQLEIKSHREKLSKLIEEIGEQPTEKFDSWSRDGWEDKIIDFPMVYKYSYGGPICESTGNSQQSNTTQELKNKYSDCVRQYVDDQKEVYYINTMLNSIKDNETYTFNVRQATLLGF